MNTLGDQKHSFTRRDFLKISALSTTLLTPGLCLFLQKVADHIAPLIGSLIPDTSAGWVKSKDNPVLGGNLGTCFDVSVLKEGDVYRMWFSWRPKKSIALVESTDGVHWNDPIICLAPENTHGWEEDVNRPTVIKLSDGYHIWYSGQTQENSWIGYATSVDGKVWNRVSQNPVLSADVAWERGAVMCPDVIFDARKGIYRMWYSGGNIGEPVAIGYALSPDGINWTKHINNPIFTPDPDIAWEKERVGACHVVLDGEWQIMFYIGFCNINHAQIGIARSKDGISDWQRHHANPIIRPGVQQWDEDAVYKPATILENDRWMLWYNGRRGGIEQIGLVVHEGVSLGFLH
jgi:beta-1,2-mannobiose phosphorylase / 1,2-beta-oligomannan phosphorylase